MENLRSAFITIIRSDEETSRRVERWVRREGNSYTLENLSTEMFNRMMERLAINRPTENPKHSIPKDVNATASLYHTKEQREDFPQLLPRAGGGVQGEGLGKHQREVDVEAVKSTTVGKVDISGPNTIIEEETSDEDSTSTGEPVSFAASLTAPTVPQVEHTTVMEGAASSVHAEHLVYQLSYLQDEDSTAYSYTDEEGSAEGSFISDTTSVSSEASSTPIPVLPQQRMHTQVNYHDVAPRAQDLIAGATAVPHGQLHNQNLNETIYRLTKMLEYQTYRIIDPENRGNWQHLQRIGIKIEQQNIENARLQSFINTQAKEKENNIRVIHFLHEQLVKRKKEIKELKRQMNRLEKKHVEKIEEFYKEISATQEGLSKNAEALGRVQEKCSNLSDENKLLQEKCQLQKEKLEAYEKRDEANRERKEQMAFLVEKLDQKFLNEVQKREQDLEELVAYGQKH